MGYSAAGARFKWVVPEVYPIFVAIGGAVGLCGFFCTRQMTQSPGFRCWKTNRMNGDEFGEEKHFKQGQNYREHVIRRYLRTVTPQIMPGINNAMSKP